MEKNKKKRKSKNKIYIVSRISKIILINITLSHLSLNGSFINKLAATQRVTNKFFENKFKKENIEERKKLLNGKIENALKKTRQDIEILRKKLKQLNNPLEIKNINPYKTKNNVIKNFENKFKKENIEERIKLLNGQIENALKKTRQNNESNLISPNSEISNSNISEEIGTNDYYIVNFFEENDDIILSEKQETKGKLVKSSQEEKKLNDNEKIGKIERNPDSNKEIKLKQLPTKNNSIYKSKLKNTRISGKGINDFKKNSKDFEKNEIENLKKRPENQVAEGGKNSIDNIFDSKDLEIIEKKYINKDTVGEIKEVKNHQDKNNFPSFNNNEINNFISNEENLFLQSNGYEPSNLNFENDKIETSNSNFKNDRSFDTTNKSIIIGDLNTYINKLINIKKIMEDSIELMQFNEIFMTINSKSINEKFSNNSSESSTNLVCEEKDLNEINNNEYEDLNKINYNNDYDNDMVNIMDSNDKELNIELEVKENTNNELLDSTSSQDIICKNNNNRESGVEEDDDLVNFV